MLKTRTLFVAELSESVADPNRWSTAQSLIDRAAERSVVAFGVLQERRVLFGMEGAVSDVMIAYAELLDDGRLEAVQLIDRAPIARRLLPGTDLVEAAELDLARLGEGEIGCKAALRILLNQTARSVAPLRAA